MANNTYAGIAVGIVFAIIAIFAIHEWLATEVSSLDGAGVTTFEGRVVARIRVGGSDGFFLLKSGAGTLTLRVKGDVISIRAPGWNRRVAAWLSLDYTFAASDVTARLTSSGEIDVPSTDNEAYVVISADHKNRAIELAVAPSNGDVDRLVAALAQAGVTEIDESPDKS